MAKHPGQLKELVRGFATRTTTRRVGTKQPPFRQVKLPRAQVISSIKATQAAVQKIARIEGISSDAAAKRLRTIGAEIKTARARLSGILSGAEARGLGKARPLTTTAVVRRLTGKAGGKPISREIAQLVAGQQTRVKGAKVRVIRAQSGLQGSRRTPDRFLRTRTSGRRAGRR